MKVQDDMQWEKALPGNFVYCDGESEKTGGRRTAEKISALEERRRPKMQLGKVTEPSAGGEKWGEVS